MTAPASAAAPLPSYLTGLKAPVADETGAVDLPVTGTLPVELNGRYFRNGPNPAPGSDPGSWFTGDGMLHGVRLREGRAEWYRNRWVETERRAGAPYIGPSGVDIAAVQANTNVIRHADRILALVESGLPYEVTPDLATVGPCDFGGRLTTAMTAHPKQDPVTGELHFFGYGFRPPYLTYHRLNTAGELVHSSVVDVPGPTMMHDFAITANHVVWLDLPVVFERERVGKGMPYDWSDAYGARIGVMSQAEPSRIRWYDVDPGYVFHVGNAHEDSGGRIVLEAVRYSRDSFRAIWRGVGGDPSTGTRWPASYLHRWILDPATGAVTETALDDRDVEFPTFDETRLGRESRYLYTVGDDEILKYDTTTGKVDTRDAEGVPGEAVYVPREDARTEDDGWLMSIVTDRAGEGSWLAVLDAGTLEDVAKVRLPRRVPLGFHGNWLAD